MIAGDGGDRYARLSGERRGGGRLMAALCSEALRSISCCVAIVRLLGFLCLLLLAQAAQALTLPVDGVYGAGEGCAIQSRHGIDTIVAAGGTEEFVENDDADEAILATPNYVVGSDWVCEPGTIDGDYAALLCVTDGATWVPMPIAGFKPHEGTMYFIMDDEAPVALERCDP